MLNGISNTVSNMRIQAVLFDAYGTLFDVHSVVQTADMLFPGQGAALSLLWRDKQIEYTRLLTLSAAPGTEDRARHPGARYRPFWDLTRAGLRYAALRLQLPLTEAAEERLMDAYRTLQPFAENAAVLTELQRRGVPAGILSNGDPAMLQAAVHSAGFTPLLQHLLSVDSVHRYKTDPAAYALGPAALGLPAQDILFVSSNAWDAVAATWYGYSTLWVNRAGLPPEQLDTEPTRTGSSLSDVLGFFPASHQTP
jgi:2-haloacid dehalogenase